MRRRETAKEIRKRLGYPELTPEQRQANLGYNLVELERLERLEGDKWRTLRESESGCFGLSLRWANRSKVYGLWWMRGDALSRSMFSGKDPATFTTGHPEFDE